ncbi:MAG TPA: undecaprenyl-diphosphate phosphatase [Solirubrobacterales bacterium]|nr:undecaprenyl-diphosphate phosphatase [Solirubrobacterales bacterium]HNK35176.1 undecaprenyl-diphosphate phosphatase [Solirubrobacterales bacterium]HNN19715.1 undecaprenyl-diphosphate phosphatase [Solirubrobacterales bacterium]
MVLGLVQGPAELLPISSSAHLAMLPGLLRWDPDELDPELRKSFEVALHGGAALALLITRRGEIRDEIGEFDLRRASVLLLSFLPAAAVGYGFERVIESRFGGPRGTATGLILGGLAMALADRRPQERGRGEADWKDGLALGIGQAAALIPGVSRNGATLTAARLRRFSRDQANLLSRTVALPVILGAVGLKGVRLARRGISRRQARWLAIGTVTSFASTMAATDLIRMVERDRALAPYAAYRIAFALLILARLAADRGDRAAE